VTLELLTIVRKPRKKDEKSRSFSVRLLGFFANDWLWEHTVASPRVAPIYIAYLGSEQELGPFSANFRGAQPARVLGIDLQLPKKAPHRFLTHKLPGASLTIAYLPELFHLDPHGVLGERIEFVFAPPSGWVAAQARELVADFGDDAPDAARAALFAAYLDRRCSAPILGSLGFHLQLYRAALAQSWVAQLEDPRNRSELWGLHHPRWGLDPPVSVGVDQATFEQFLVSQTSIYYQKEIQHGTHRFQAGGRLLPFPKRAAEQLCFDFGFCAGDDAHGARRSVRG